MKKVKLDVIKPWISKKITDLLGFEDEVLIGYVFGLLEEKVLSIPHGLLCSNTLIQRIYKLTSQDFWPQTPRNLCATCGNYSFPPRAALVVYRQHSWRGRKKKFALAKLNKSGLSFSWASA